MALVDIICLANSFKEGGRCVAGLRTDGKGWVRPVAPDTSHSQLYERQLKLDDGTEPQLLDVVTVDLHEARPAPGQPENWVIGKTPWVLWERPAGRQLEPRLRSALNRNETLLGFDGRSIPESDAGSVTSSLTLVAPPVVLWSLGRDVGYRQQPAVLLKLGAKWLRLPVTDPVWVPLIVRHLSGKEAGWHKNEAAGIPPGAKVWITVSLSEPFHGQCYKLAAAIVVRKPATSASRIRWDRATRARP